MRGNFRGVLQVLASHIFAESENNGVKAPLARYAGYGVVDAVKSGMCGANPLKYHAGAVAAWEEAGFTIDDCAKP